MRLSVQIEFDKLIDLTTHKTKAIVGRAPDSDIVIPHTSISRSHCHVEFAEDGHFYVTDLGSSNGSFINNLKLIPHQRTQYSSDMQLVLGKLDCELGHDLAPTHEVVNPINPGPAQADASSTMRIQRLDLNKPSLTHKMEKEQKEFKEKRPRNPITNDLQNPKRRPPKSKFLLIVVLVIVAIIHLFLINLAMN